MTTNPPEPSEMDTGNVSGSDIASSQEAKLLDSESEIQAATAEMEGLKVSPTREPGPTTQEDVDQDQGDLPPDQVTASKKRSKHVSGSEMRRRRRERARAGSTPLVSANVRATLTDGAATPKRQRGQMETPPDLKAPPPKKPKQLNIADVVKKAGLWRRLYREDGNPILPAEVDAIRSALDNLILQGIQDPMDLTPPPIFEGLRLSDGNVIATCANEHSANWLAGRIGNFSSILDSAILIGELTPEIMPEPLTRTVFWLGKGAPKKTEDCLNALAVQNPGLQTTKWRIWNRFEASGNSKVICGITKDSEEFIKSKQGKLHFLSSAITAECQPREPRGKKPNKVEPRTSLQGRTATAQNQKRPSATAPKGFKGQGTQGKTSVTAPQPPSHKLQRQRDGHKPASGTQGNTRGTTTTIATQGQSGSGKGTRGNTSVTAHPHPQFSQGVQGVSAMTGRPVPPFVPLQPMGYHPVPPAQVTYPNYQGFNATPVPQGTAPSFAQFQQFQSWLATMGGLFMAPTQGISTNDPGHPMPARESENRTPDPNDTGNGTR